MLLTMALHKLTLVIGDLSEPSGVFYTCSDETLPGHRPLPTSLLLFVHIIVQFLTIKAH